MIDPKLQGKVALITGASKGLGRAIAEEFAKEGVHVSICARGKEDLEKAAAGLRQHGVTVQMEPDPVVALAQARCQAQATDVVCATGSLYLVGEIKTRLQGLAPEF